MSVGWFLYCDNFIPWTSTNGGSFGFASLRFDIKNALFLLSKGSFMMCSINKSQ